MYIIDDICYAGTPSDNILLVKVIGAKPLPGGMVLATFSTGEKRLFDIHQLKGSAFAPLAEEAIFNTLQVTHGFVSWDNGNIDISPEYMYENSYAYNESRDIVRA